MRFATTFACSALFCLVLGGASSSADLLASERVVWGVKTVATFPEGISAAALRPQHDAVVEISTVSGLFAFSRLKATSLSTGKTVNGSLVFTGAELVRVGSMLAVFEARTERAEPNGAEAPVTGLQPAEVRVLSTGAVPQVEKATYVPADISDAPTNSSASGSLWIGETGKVVLVSTQSGAVLRSISLPEPTARYTVSTFGSLLFAMSDAVGTEPVEVDEVAIGTGRVMATRSVEAIGGYPVAVSSGVWVSYRTGMLGTAELLGVNGLRPVDETSQANSNMPLPGSFQAMGIQVVVNGGTAWLSANSGIACVSATTGRVLGDSALPHGVNGLSVIGVVKGHLYAVASGTSGEMSIVRVEAPPSCFD